MDKACKSICDEIAVWKSRNGTSDEDIAIAIGISRDAFSKKKSGARAFKANELIAMCDLFGCDPNALLGYN